MNTFDMTECRMIVYDGSGFERDEELWRGLVLTKYYIDHSVRYIYFLVSTSSNEVIYCYDLQRMTVKEIVIPIGCDPNVYRGSLYWKEWKVLYPLY